jgi:integrase
VGTTGKTRRAVATKAGNDNASRVQLGPFWLWYRSERDDWSICWYDDGGPSGERRTCRKSTGIGGGDRDHPPQEAEDALADHYATWRKGKPGEQVATEAFVVGFLADWLEEISKKNEDPGRAADCVKQWLIFFDIERAAGRITGAPVITDINKSLCARYIDWRKVQPGKKRGTTISGGTISRELAALRAALRLAWQDEKIPAAPFIPDVPDDLKAKPKEEIYSAADIARILEAALRMPERWHVHRFVMTMLSTHSRVEAVLELDCDSQLRDGLFYFLVPGETQTKKRRSIVPVAPTLAPWLADARGTLIQYRTMTARKTWADPDVPEYFERPTSDIGRAFEACLIEAGVCEQEVDADGRAIWLEPRRKLGETALRPKMRGIGSPNTLRHTISTHLHAMGVPEAQIDMAAGHAGEGTNKRNYRHLRPEYLKEFIEGVEVFWRKVGEHTKAHLRSHCDPKIINFGYEANKRKSIA